MCGAYTLIGISLLLLSLTYSPPILGLSILFIVMAYTIGAVYFADEEEENEE
jgi:hypothetical protein